MTDYNKKPTTEQLKTLGKIIALIQELFNEGNGTQMAPKYNTSEQLIQYHADNYKKEHKLGKWAEKGESK